MKKLKNNYVKWLKELYGGRIHNYNWIIEFEFFNKIFHKPELTYKNLNDISDLFHKYLNFLCNKNIESGFNREYTGHINYKLFFAKAFKFLNIVNIIVYPVLSKSNSMNFWNDTWEEFIIKLNDHEDVKVSDENEWEDYANKVLRISEYNMKPKLCENSLCENSLCENPSQNFLLVNERN